MSKRYWLLWLLWFLFVLLASGNSCDKPKKGPAKIKWKGVPASAAPTCGDESPESRVYTCVFDNTVYTCIQDSSDETSYDCAPKVFEKQTAKDVPAEKPLVDAGVVKDAAQ